MKNMLTCHVDICNCQYFVHTLCRVCLFVCLYMITSTVHGINNINIVNASSHRVCGACTADGFMTRY